MGEQEGLMRRYEGRNMTEEAYEYVKWGKSAWSMGLWGNSWPWQPTKQATTTSSLLMFLLLMQAKLTCLPRGLPAPGHLSFTFFHPDAPVINNTLTLKLPVHFLGWVARMTLGLFLLFIPSSVLHFLSAFLHLFPYSHLSNLPLLDYWIRPFFHLFLMRPPHPLPHPPVFHLLPSPRYLFLIHNFSSFTSSGL